MKRVGVQVKIRRTAPKLFRIRMSTPFLDKAKKQEHSVKTATVRPLPTKPM